MNRNAYIGQNVETLFKNSISDHPSLLETIRDRYKIQGRFLNAKPGQTIFDSHVGSGSIRIACHDLGFDFEGCELDKDYWNAQEERFKSHTQQGELFENTEMQGLIYD